MKLIHTYWGPIIPGRFAVFAVFSCGFSVFHDYQCGFSVLQTVAVCGNGRIFNTVFVFISYFQRFLGFQKIRGLQIFASLLRLAVCWYFPPYHGLRFAPVRYSERLTKLVQMNIVRLISSIRSIDIFQYPVIRWIHDIVFTVRSFETDKVVFL